MNHNVLSVIIAVGLVLSSCTGEKKPVENKPAQSPPETTMAPERHDTVSSQPPAAVEKPVTPKEETKVSSAPKQVTLVGELVDLVSFISSGKQGSPDAVRKSAEVGNPIGFYETAIKKIYVVGLPQINTPANPRLLPYVGMKVFVIGKAYQRNGVDVIVMSDIGKSIK